MFASETKARGVTEATELLQRIDDRTWRGLPLELRWKIIPWAIDGGELDHAARLIEATERERGESVKLVELRIRLAAAQRNDPELARLIELRYERYPSASATVQLARYLLDQGEVDRAAELYDSLRQTHGQQQQVQHLGDAIDRATSTPSEVRARLQRELTADPDGFWPNVFMATWLIDNDRADAARPLLHKVLVDAIERGAETQLSRMADLLDRAGEREIAADLRARAAAERERRRTELQAQIETALENVVEGSADWEIEEVIAPRVSSAPAPQPAVESSNSPGRTRVATGRCHRNRQRTARPTRLRCAATRFRAHHLARWATAGHRARTGRESIPSASCRPAPANRSPSSFQPCCCPGSPSSSRR